MKKRVEDGKIEMDQGQKEIVFLFKRGISKIPDEAAKP